MINHHFEDNYFYFNFYSHMKSAKHDRPRFQHQTAAAQHDLLLTLEPYEI